ncbi:FAD-binding protein [Cryptosporangium sp. NPDC051539]|uniref:FAD-dependent oxidoreductase n=1 Tax=Cryptosporangium sp. NPDC051539 TaxID=3363962 RepID=UPI0037A1E5CC
MTDVVVVAGGGLAGHAAALAAAEAGADVVLHEKQPDVGGSSALSGGGLLFAGTALQREAGVDDSAAALRADLAEAGRGASDPVLLDAYADAQAGTYEWLAGLGAAFTLVGPRLHVLPQGALVRLLHERALASPRIRYHANSSVTALPGAQVVLATGGFSRSPELIERLAPQCAGAVPMGGAGNTGDGLRMALDRGAGLAGIEYVEASFGASVTPGVPPRLLYAQFDGGVIVNAAGERFADERNDIKALGRASAAQPGGTVYQVFDASVMALSKETPAPRNFAAALRDGLLVSAASRPELAGVLGVPADALERSASGLTNPPYYAYACRAGLTTTYGGLRVDGSMRVLAHDSAVIPGLFAAGELVGGFHGAGYLVGSALGKAAVFGRLAGRHAAALPVLS